MKAVPNRTGTPPIQGQGGDEWAPQMALQRPPQRPKITSAPAPPTVPQPQVGAGMERLRSAFKEISTALQGMTGGTRGTAQPAPTGSSADARPANGGEQGMLTELLQQLKPMDVGAATTGGLGKLGGILAGMLGPQDRPSPATGAPDTGGARTVNGAPPSQQVWMQGAARPRADKGGN